MLGAMTNADPRRFDAMLVSNLLDASPRVLPLLVRHGFAPLRNAAMRTALAPTVTLAQAVRLRGLAPDRADALRRALADLLVEEGSCR